MHLQLAKKLGWIIFGIVTLVLFVFTIIPFFQGVTRQKMVIGAGSENGEAFQFALAIADLAQKHIPPLDIEVIPTAGSKENMELLSKNVIQLATVQADIESVPQARIVSNLYPDLFQLVVHDSSEIYSFRDLKNKRIALPSKGGGQFISFWSIASHFGITESDIEVVHLKDLQAEIESFKNRTVDALFRVRAPKNSAIAKLIHQCPTRIVPISQGNAIKLTQPAFTVTHIPEGTYRGNPAIPEKDIATIGVQRLLIARSDADDAAIKEITRLLYERRRELLLKTPLAGFITQPDWGEGTFIPMHSGAQQYYNREEPLYIVENADFFALLLSAIIGVLSGGWWIRSYFQEKQKNTADHYAKEILKLTDSVRKCNKVEEVLGFKKQIMEILSRVVDDLDRDKINAEGFHFFSFTWQVAHDLIIEKLIEMGHRAAPSIEPINSENQ
ncbi:MAG: TAXI family TRAP transporter solute-binding subunit [Bacteroidota bacterium]